MTIPLLELVLGSTKQTVDKVKTGAMPLAANMPYHFSP